MQENCYLAYLDSHEANELVIKEDKKDSEKIVDMFMDSIFKGVERSYIEKMVYSFTQGSAACGDILIKDGDVPQYVYVLRSGSVKVAAC